MSVSHSSSPSSAPAISTKEAVAQLEAFESTLDLDIVLRPNDKNQNRALNRITDKALSLAADVVASDPARFADFAGLSANVAYVQALAPVAAQAATLAAHLDKSVQNHRSPAAQQALALYAVAKGLGRITDNETVREKIALLKAEIAPKRKNARPKQTKAQKAAKRAAASWAVRVAKAMKVLSDAGSLPAAASPGAASASSSAAPPATN